MKTVHWLGAGLSSGPGIIRMAEILESRGQKMILWNRTESKAYAVFAAGTKDGTVTDTLLGVKKSAGLPKHVTVKALDLAMLQKGVSAGDVVVSMLPATMHVEVAELCLSVGAHLVTTSYVSPAMAGLSARAQEKGLCFVNECGLDPGIDHMMAHKLVASFKWGLLARREDLPRGRLVFHSYCGGVPKEANDFRYKFSWSPAGVLRALTNRAKYVENGAEQIADRAWEVVKSMTFGPKQEQFEVYPNRDSIPYIKEYAFDERWKLLEFVRGTIRLGGWKEAWKDIFAQIPNARAADLEALGQKLWEKYAYAAGEQDRVVLYVGLKEVANDGTVLWDCSYWLDDSGSGRDTAMGKLVSWPATLAVEDVLDGQVKPGVTAAPHEAERIERWFKVLGISESGVSSLDKF